MALIYKPLFEVKLLHEYFLSKPKGETIFDLDQPEDRQLFLTDKFRSNEDSISSFLEYKIPDALSAAMESQQLRLLPAYSGFKVLARVNALSSSGGTRYLPAIPLATDFNLIVSLVKKSTRMDDVTNAAINSAFTRYYYFSNTGQAGIKKAPLLTMPVPAFDASKTYEQGELAEFGAGGIRRFFKDEGGNNWRDLKGGGFVNEQDRMLAPLRFNYVFPPAGTITRAEISLKDNTGNDIKTWQFFGAPLTSVLLDLRHLSLNTLPVVSTAGKIQYFLHVNAGNGFSKIHPLVFISNDIFSPDIWGLLHIQPESADSDFSLLDADGFLKTRREPNGGRSGTPVFEIRLTSRLSYWRYINDKRKDLELSAATSDFLINKRGRLISKAPKPLTGSISLFKKGSDNTFHYLPNPAAGELLRIEEERLIADILVPESAMFPVAP